MSSNQKKTATLVVLLGLWGGLAAWQWLAGPEPVRVPLTNVAGPASSAQPSPRTMQNPLHVQLDLLAAARTQREMAFTAPRNIFTLPSSSGAGQLALDAESDPANPQLSAGSELAEYHYLGFVQTGEEWEQKRNLAVVTKDDDLHLVRKGEIVENHIVVKAITQDSITLLDRRSREEYTVPLSEEALSQP